MPISILVVTPPHACDPQLAIAAVRAGACGVVDLGFQQETATRRHALNRLLRYIGKNEDWGIRWDLLARNDRLPNCLTGLLDEKAPRLILAGLDFRTQDLAEVARQSRAVAHRVFLEAYGIQDALAAQEAGFDGVILVGNEAGGRVSPHSSFILLQRLRGTLRVPSFVRGGIGLHTGAAALLAGATGVVLGEQLWLCDESPLPAAEKRSWRQLDGSETVAFGDDGLLYRFFSRHGRPTLLAWDRELAAGGDWPRVLSDRLIDPATPDAERLLPVGQEIAFAGDLADRFENVSSIVRAFQKSAEEDRYWARDQQALASGAPLAQKLGIKYPILQGPMTRVSDVTAFSQKVADEGALPFLALALLHQPNLGKLLRDTAAAMDERPWGVGLLGFVPAELRKEQSHAVCQARPKFAILAGGRPSQAKELDELGIATFLHVPSPQLLADFLSQGARRFIFEGSECGGHVGPRTSFTLWQSMIGVLLGAALPDPENVQVVFAGGIHDDLSAAMASVVAAPLAARGMKVGVLMGTAYLFTPEAVEAGAITPEFQRQAIACEKTALLVSGLGHVTRAAKTPFVEEFNAKRKALLLAGKNADEIKYELEVFNVGRLRVASKGLVRKPAGNGLTQSTLVHVDEPEQRRSGLYMIGEAATLHRELRPMAELHEQVSCGSHRLLEESKEEPQPPSRPRRRPRERLAIVGLGCIFPESPNLRSYWHNILRGFHVLREVPPERWHAEDFYVPDRMTTDRVCSTRAGFLDEIRFDPFRYHIPPAAMSSIEPIQLLALEVARQALEDAGYGRRHLPQERTSVIFAGAGTNDLGLAYAFRVGMRHWLPRVESLDRATREKILADLERMLPKWTEDSFPGFLLNVVPGRIANRFNLRGSNVAVDAACASSLAALQVAAEQLRAGICDAALVGSADGSNNPFCFMSFARTFALSPHRSCPFDEKSDGIDLGEGLGAMLLKRLSDAERDGDKIYALVAGIGTSSDGPARSLTAPNPDGQMLALARAYEDAGLSPATVTLVEAHSTGTPVGDEVEVKALTKIFAAAGAAPRSCAIGSVKSMIGHTKAVAGVASLIKTTLALKHKVLPPTYGIQQPHVLLRSDECPFYANTEPRPWFHGSQEPRRAGVSAFGFGGTNFHAVLEEYQDDYRTDSHEDLTPRAAELFAWSRSTRQEIVRALVKLDKGLAMAPTQELAQLAYSVLVDNETRHAGSAPPSNCRLAIVATSVEELREKVQLVLKDLAENTAIDNPTGVFCSEAPPVESRQVCVLFPGQGSQAVNMLRDLVLFSPWSWHRFEKADQHLAEFFEQPLTRYIYPLPAFSDEERRTQQEQLTDTRRAQPALGLVEIFAYDLIARFGIEPGMVAGHSYGEYMALYAAGVLSPEDMLRVSTMRGHLIREASKDNPGAMASVSTGEEEITAALKQLNLDAQAANLNADNQTVIAGSAAAVDAAVKHFSEKGLRTKKLQVTGAFHTPAMQGAREILERHLATTAFHAPRMPIFSNVTGTLFPDDPQEICRLMAEQMVVPVQFIKILQEAYAAGARVFLEIGPGTVLTGLVRRNLRDRPHVALSLDAKGQNGWLQLAHFLARLSVMGLPVKLKAWFEGRQLSYATTAELFRKVRRESMPKPTDWLVGPGGSRPAKMTVASPGRDGTKQASTGDGLTAQKQEIAATGTDHGQATSQPSQAAASPTPPLSTTPAGDGQRSPPRASPSAHVPLTSRTLESMAVEREHQPDGNHNNDSPVAPAPTDGTLSAEVIAQFQYAMTQWLELQKEQQQTSQLFLDTQQTVMLACLGAAPQGALVRRIPRPAMTSPAAIPPRPFQARVAAAPTAPAVRPPARTVAHIPVAEPAKPAVAVPTAGPVGPAAAPSVTKVAPAAAPPPPAPAATPAPAVAAGDGKAAAVAPVAAAPSSGNGSEIHESRASASGAPTLEVFREDLLEAISERTGYPTEMLNEKLELEAGLGIDSIKTIEIFGLLSKYHAYLPGASEDQEESLAAFAKLRTIGDILAAYENNRQAKKANGTQDQSTADRAATGRAASAGGDGHPPVERATLRAVQAAAPSDGGQKKNFPKVTSS